MKRILLAAALVFLAMVVVYLGAISPRSNGGKCHKEWESGLSGRSADTGSDRRLLQGIE